MVFNHERLQPERGGMPWGKEMVPEALLPALLVQTSRWKLLGFAGAILILCRSCLKCSPSAIAAKWAEGTRSCNLHN